MFHFAIVLRVSAVLTRAVLECLSCLHRIKIEVQSKFSSQTLAKNLKLSSSDVTSRPTLHNIGLLVILTINIGVLFHLHVVTRYVMRFIRCIHRC